MLLINRHFVEDFQDALNDLNWRVRAVRILADPHLQEPASLHVQKELLDMLLFQQLRDFIDHFEPMHCLLVVLDALIVSHTSLMHPLHEVDCN